MTGKKDYSTKIENVGGNVSILHNYESYKTKLPSLISDIILNLSKALDQKDDFGSYKGESLPYSIEDKIEHNNLVKYRLLVEEYGDYGFILDSVYNTLEQERPNSRSRFFRYIKHLYVSTLGDIMKNNDSFAADKTKAIKENSDNIIDTIMLRLKENVLVSSDPPNLCLEDLEFGLSILVCKAFIDCKILENPAGT